MKRRTAFAMLLAVLALLAAAVEPFQPEADSAAVVTVGEARFTLLTSRLVRMEWSSDRIFEDRASLVFLNRRLPVPQYRIDDSGEWLLVSTDKLNLRYKKGSGSFNADNLSVTFELGGQLVSWHPGLADPQNLKGTTRTLDGTNGEKDLRLEQGILSRAGWALVDDSERPLFDGSEWNWILPRPPAERQDWYFFGYGHDYKSALGDFTRIAGRIPLPPRFAFGYWWSRYWTYSDEELRDLVAGMKLYDIPIDVLIVDMDWHETWGLSGFNTRRDPFGQAIGWTGYTWNRSLFPDPGRFLEWAHGQGLKVALNLHPASGIAPMEEKYGDFARAYGWDAGAGQYIPFRIEEKKWVQAWFDVILHPLEALGIDFWWLDWQAWQENKTIRNLSNTWWLNYVFFSDMERRGKRPLLFHRWGGIGNHRYQIGFSGDTFITWDSLAFQPYFTATAANVGYGYWSHDIGGHMGTENLDPELYLRWLQFGVYSPILRTHSTKSAAIERRIWKYPQHFELMRGALHLRYALFPYIYTAARQSYDSGVSICRPMYYDWPDSQEAYDFTGQYMFGDDLLVAPVTAKADPLSGQAQKKIWLPPGEWYEWPRGSMLVGDRVHERSFALSEIPVYARAGSIIPMRPKTASLGENPKNLILTLIPGARGEATIYEDDGSTTDYQQDVCVRTRVTQEALADGSLRIVIGPREGNMAPASAERSFEIQLPRTLPPANVTLNGQGFPPAEASAAASWSYDGPQLTTRILLPSVASGSATEILISWPKEAKSGARLLDGKIGLLGRLPRIVQMMKDEVNRRDAIANAPAQVLQAGSLASRLRLKPEQTAKILADFDNKFPELVDQIIEFPRGDPNTLEAVIRQLPLAAPLAARPQIKIENPVSEAPTLLEITAADAAAEIRYTLDGSVPGKGSLQYATPLTIEKSTLVRARSFQPGCLPSFTVSALYQRIWAREVTLAAPCSPRYTGGGDFALVNGFFGQPDDIRSDWVGFQGADMSATIVLAEPRDITAVKLRFLQNQDSWIFLPARVRIEVSADGVSYRGAFEKEMKAVAEDRDGRVLVKEIRADIQAQGVSHLRITAVNIGVCPAWHPGAGAKAWLFSDEIVLE